MYAKLYKLYCTMAIFLYFSGGRGIYCKTCIGKLYKKYTNIQKYTRMQITYKN